MKTNLSLIVAVATAIGSTFASAQDEKRPPEAPPRDEPGVPLNEGPRPPGAPAERPGVPLPESGGNQRGPEGPRRGGDSAPRDAVRGPNTPDGQRGPGAWRDGERGSGTPRDGARTERRNEGGATGDMVRPQKPTAYLGVSTGPVPPPLGAQLNLPEGFGLLVEQVVPESPAAKAGLQRYDVLRLLNDQQLTDPEQLAALVRHAGKDAEVSITVLRKGAEQKLTVKVGERLLPEKPVGGRFGDFNWRVEPLRQIPEMARDAAKRAEEQARRMQEQFRAFQEKMGDFQKRLQEWQKDPSGKPPEAPKLDLPQPPEAPKAPEPPRPPGGPDSPGPADLLRESRPGGAPQVRVDQDGNVTTWNTAQARIVIKDDQGEIVLRSENGRRFATVRNAAGGVTFDGPVDTAEQRHSLPEDVRRKIELSGVETLVHSEGGRGRAYSKSRTGETPIPRLERAPAAASDSIQ